MRSASRDIAETVRDPLIHLAAEAGAEQQRPEIVELGNAEGVGAVELLGEGRDLQGLAENSPGGWPRVVEDHADVEVDVREYLRHVSGDAMEREAMQHGDIDAHLVQRLQERHHQRRIVLVDDRIPVAESDMELDRHLALPGQFGANPQAMAQQRRLFHARAASLDLRQPFISRCDDLVLARRRRIEIEAAAIGDHRLQSDGRLAGSRQFVGKRARELGGANTRLADPFGDCLDAHNFARGHANGLGHLRWRKNICGSKPAIDQQQTAVCRLYEPPIYLGGPQCRPALDIGFGIGKAVEVEDRCAFRPDRQTERRVEMAGPWRAHRQSSRRSSVRTACA